MICMIARWTHRDKVSCNELLRYERSNIKIVYDANYVLWIAA